MNREILWYNMNRTTQLYKWISLVNNLRKYTQIWAKKQIQRYADDNFYAFTRDSILALFTNTDNYIQKTITYHSYSEGNKLCNLFDISDCVYVKNNKIDVSLNGEPKVYVLA